MISAEERIKKLARDKAIDEADAASLLAVVGTKTRTASRLSALTNPFARFSGEVTAAAGVLVAALGVLVSRLGVRFDGVLDLHTATAPVTLRVALIDQGVAFPLTALVFWLVARVAVRGVRLVDVAGVVGLSRAPAILLAIPFILESARTAPSAPMTPLLGLSLACALTGTAAQLYLLFVGFRTATGLREGRLAALFIGGAVLAEVAAKLAVMLA